MRVTILLVAWSCLLLLGNRSATAEPIARPNVVFTLTDDLGFFDLGCYGNPFHETPSIDRLAGEGLHFTHFYAGPVCSPILADDCTFSELHWTGAKMGDSLPEVLLAQNAPPVKASKPEAPFAWVSPLANAEAKKTLPLTVKHATFKSPSMGIDVGYYIYLPPSYDERKERYPVVYHLHGGRPGAESKSVKLASYVDKAIAGGTIKPTIYVFPNGGPVSWYDMPERKHGLGETVFVKELIPHIDATYRTWGTREGRALEGYSQGGRGTTRIMFKHPELFLSVAPGGSGYGPEKRIQENDGYESDSLRFLPLGYNAWDLAKVYAERTDRPPLSILVWDGTKCFNYDFNLQYSAYLKELGITHEFLAIPGVPHTATGSYDVKGTVIMQHHQKMFDAHR